VRDVWILNELPMDAGPKTGIVHKTRAEGSRSQRQNMFCDKTRRGRGAANESLAMEKQDREEAKTYKNLIACLFEEVLQHL